MVTKINYKKGLSLIELVVAMGIFTMVITIGVGAMLTMFAANQKSLALRSVMNNLNFSVESMSREIMVGTNYRCSNDDVNSIGLADCGIGSGGGSQITFCSSDDKPIAYKFEEVDGKGRIERRIGKLNDPGGECKQGVAFTWPSPGWQSITAIGVDIFVGKSKFYITGTDQGDTFQPRVLLLIDGEAGKEGQKSDFVIQTTLSQRTPDLPEQ